MEKINKYKIAKPITNTQELLKMIPKYETLPLWWDDDWYLFYINIWNKIYYMSPQGNGEFSRRKFFLYKNKPQPKLVVEKREFCKLMAFGDKITNTCHCPNCDNDLVPYDYDFERQLIGLSRVRYCPKCGYPLLWY